jgi:hypothetical protein
MSKTLILPRVSCLTVGAAAASVGMYASYEAAAQADGGYLMLAAPIVALAGALAPVYAERAFHDRQWFKGIVLMLVWLPCFVTVVGTAIERNHAAKAGGEAQRAAARTMVTRAAAELTEAKTAAAAATAAANKVRGRDGAKAKAVLATETVARERVAAAELALTKADGTAVAESAHKTPEWVLPVGLELVSMAFLWAGFTLGREKAPAQVAPVQVPVALVRTKDPRRVAAGRKAAATRAKNKAIREGKVAVIAA